MLRELLEIEADDDLLRRLTLGDVEFGSDQDTARMAAAFGSDLLGARAIAWTLVLHLEDARSLVEPWAELSKWDTERDVVFACPTPSTTEEVWQLTAERLQRLLQSFGPQIVVANGPAVLPETNTLAEACAVDLHNLLLDPLPWARMAEGEPAFNYCRNETCGRRFLRQRGTAQKGQFRTSGVEYCSYRCANTQGQRDRRRRSKEGSDA